MKNKGKLWRGVLVIMGLLGLVQPVFAATYDIDPAHSTLGFAAKHLMVSTVRGNFTDYQGQIEFDKDNPDVFKANVTIQVKSINTNSEARDKHLRSPDFFDADQFPTITFSSKKLVKQGDAYQIIGDLKMRDVTKEVSIPVTIAGPVKTPFGSDAIGIAGEITINRQDFGIKWNKNLDSGGAVVDDNVKIIVEVEAHSKKVEK